MSGREPSRSVYLVRFVAFHISPVRRRWVRLGLVFCGLSRGVQPSCAIVATIFYVIVFRQRRNHSGSTLNLADAAQDDFGAALVGFYGSADFDGASRETADITDVFQVMGENYHHEGAGHGVFTEIQEVNTFVSDVDADNLPSDAFRFADVPCGFVDGNAVGGARGTWC